MPRGLLRPNDVSHADAQRMLSFLNAVQDAQALAETVGFSDGLSAGTRVAAEILAAREVAGDLQTLEDVLAITGVTLVRFTELAIALSAARPPDPPETLRFLSGNETLWLGQMHPVAVQLLDAEGRGVPNRTVTLLASDGDLTAQVGLQRQRGRALNLATEPGGLIHVTFGPHLVPVLARTELAVLGAELSRLPQTARSPRDAARALQTIAARYRGQGSETLQNVLDRLYAAFSPDSLPETSPWPTQHVTILAMIHDETGQVSQIATQALEIRNWLGGFYAALENEVSNNSLLAIALQTLTPQAEAGLDLSRKLIQATQGFSALERGALGRRLRETASTRDVTAFLSDATGKLEGDAIVNTVRAAGASEAAIAAGGFSVFEAIRTVQDAGDVIATPPRSTGVSEKDFGALNDRLGLLETTTVTRTDLTRLTRTLTGQISALDSRFATPEQLNGLREEITKDVDDRFATQLPRDEFEQRFSAFETSFTRSLAALQRDAVTQNQFEALRGDLQKDIDTRFEQDRPNADLDARLKELETSFDARLDRIEAGAVREERLDRFEIEVRAEMDARMADTITRPEVDNRIDAVEAEMARSLRTKANASTVSRLSATVNQMNESQIKMRDDIVNLDSTGATGPGRLRE